ncbi:acyltransferase, partial [Methanobrevibacter sp.]|uniref:acyltransferase n=1 Tax=Methanobrevibacter sp. TaxID=66852 RepID=UPI003890B4E5
MEKTKRIQYISLASVLSAIAVVFLHSNVAVSYFSNSSRWFFANIIHSTFIFAVPIFFMISGAMLLDFREKYDLKTYFLKRINKTLIPYLVWSILGLIIQIYLLKTILISDVNFDFLINGLTKGTLVPVYWFFIPLFVLYLVLPLFTFIKDNTKMLVLCIFALFVLNYFYIEQVFPNWIIDTFDYAYGGYIAFALTGYLIHKNEVPKKIRLLIYIMALLGFLTNLFGTYYMSLSIGGYYGNFRKYTNIICILYSVGLFVFIKYNTHRILEFNFIKRLVSFLDS